MTAPMVDYKIHWLKMMSVPESRAVVGRHDGINGRDKGQSIDEIRIRLDYTFRRSQILLFFYNILDLFSV